MHLLEEIKLEDHERQLTEVWLPVCGFEDLYEVSNLGKVRNISSGKILKQWRRSSYYLVDLYVCGQRHVRSVHHLVFDTFDRRDREGLVIHHVDYNKDNNMLSNLQLCTFSEHNKIHRHEPWNKGIAYGLTKGYLISNRVRLSNTLRREEDTYLLAKELSVHHIAEILGITTRTVYERIAKHVSRGNPPITFIRDTYR